MFEIYYINIINITIKNSGKIAQYLYRGHAAINYKFI